MPASDIYVHTLHQAIARYLYVGEPGRFELANGQTSHYYLDFRGVMSEAEAAIAVGRLGVSRISALAPDFIIGVATGGIAVATAINLEGYHALAAKWRTRMLYVRSRPKGYGRNRLIEGLHADETLAGKSVVVVEDTFTTGASAVAAANAALNQGAAVRLVLAAFDREEGAAQAIGEVGLPWASLAQAHTFLPSGTA